MATPVGAPAGRLVARATRARPDGIGVALSGLAQEKDVTVPISPHAEAPASPAARAS